MPVSPFFELLTIPQYLFVYRDFSDLGLDQKNRPPEHHYVAPSPMKLFLVLPPPFSQPREKGERSVLVPGTTLFFGSGSRLSKGLFAIAHLEFTSEDVPEGALEHPGLFKNCQVVFQGVPLSGKTSFFDRPL